MLIEIKRSSLPPPFKTYAFGMSILLLMGCKYCKCANIFLMYRLHENKLPGTWSEGLENAKAYTKFIVMLSVSIRILQSNDTAIVTDHDDLILSPKSLLKDSQISE